jgi:hypothetical protein
MPFTWKPVRSVSVRLITQNPQLNIVGGAIWICAPSTRTPTSTAQAFIETSAAESLPRGTRNPDNALARDCTRRLDDLPVSLVGATEPRKKKSARPIGLADRCIPLR